MSTRIELILGAGSFGKPGPKSNGARVHTVEQCREMVDAFVRYGHKKIDTARIYGGGTSEEFLGEIDVKGCTVDTKVYPMQPGDHAPARLRAIFRESIKALNGQKVHTLYLHAADRSVPYEDTLREVNEMHREGLLEEFGLSNFYAWEVAEIVGIAKRNDWIGPTVYEGCYNAVERTVETELLPCLRHFGIRFYAYSPLCGGLLVGKLLNETDLRNSTGGRWDPKVTDLAPTLHRIYAPLLPVLKELKEAAEKHGIPLPEVAQRWLQHHSLLQPGDAVILGAGSASQLEDNMKQCEGGPLSEDVVDMVNEAWAKAKANASYYAW
ncbi:hypothetical protein SERLA73DRAFT_175138 [Serpula lacrymans var. lacrymans S7.3]|uniref:NADP-dependent oxidoreductase domain-containing protein n=2 Tax=Serpula lacrymans var. lacrymans TaxID=341189 RepID=F8PKP8_SERL3|nr:uncharacterized protein SERLADRAFT_457130 [Serpula lacrymans var. lacrymans S7.9]EGO03595.1 hypothetical protein SERLA73DRAFT_175138 [Serpula lacrymans var. lacrymans S7.3]EGO29415.1 hypothetical protein SERLADRAFT_457130 [Serpula lacrymans var. lacrymans S7.9]